MRNTRAGSLGVWLLTAATLAAADFWQEKPYTAWSAQQVDKLLTDSPWARKVTVVTGTISEEALGGFEQSGAGLGGGGGASGRSDGGEAGFQRIRRLTVTVTWLSALPIKQALLRRQAGPDARITPDQERQLNADQPFYSVLVSGLPMRLAARLGTMEDVQARTALKPNGKERIAPQDIRVSRDGDQFFQVEFLFPKAHAITLDDKDVGFTTKLAGVDITRKFKLADMTVAGRLVL